jgi:hypothetical protein
VGRIIAPVEAAAANGATGRPLVASGTFPPPTSISGAAVGSSDSVEIEITMGGTHRELQFTWKLDGIVQATGQTPSTETGEYALGATGLTVHFNTDPKHPYPADNVFACAGHLLNRP